MSGIVELQTDLFIDPSAGTIPGPRALERQKERPLPDDPARDRIEGDLEASLFVEAAAGAGKTTSLVRRMVATVGSGLGALERMVAVTFTDKAAGELKLRLRTAIEEARREAEEPRVRARFDRAVRELEVARIGTIHSFCADLLRERPVEARVDPLFGVLPEPEASRVLDRAFDNWFERTLSDPPEGVARVLRRPPTRMQNGGWRGPRQELREAAGMLAEHRDFPAVWTRDEAFRHAAAMDRTIEALREIAAFDIPGPEPRAWIAKGFRKVAQFVRRVDGREEAEGRDHHRLEAEVRELLGDRTAGWTYRGSGEWYDRSRNLRLAHVKEVRDRVRVELESLLARAEADLAARLREELRPVVEGYQERKRREGALDFLDLLLKARDLVVGNVDVRRDLQRRFSHFFVDEFQDTDPLQAEILLLLASDDPEQTDFRRVRPVPGKLFLVGDPKQSIYSFRRADVRIYEETKRRLLERGTELVRLTTSFRSVPGIQEAVNAAFELAIRPAADGSQAEYVPLEPFREATPGQPAVVALPAPAPYSDWGRVVKWRVSGSYADAVGAFVQWLVEESGWKVTEPGRPKERVPIRARHICILSRRLKSYYEEVMQPYVRALEARGVPHVLVGGKGFHDREEILALRNALQAIEWPDDALSVYATLRGPFFALADEALLAYKHAHGALHPLAAAASEDVGDEGTVAGDEVAEGGDEGTVAGDEAPQGGGDAVTEALAILADLHRGRNRRPIAQTLTRLLSAVRAHAGIAIWPAGEQALANCLRLVDRAREFERDGASSFRAFVERLQEEAERDEGQDAPIVEEGTQGVRIMSVHRAKGLEFPIVILADPTNSAVWEKPSRHVDAERGLWAERICGAIPSDVLDHHDEELARERAEAIRLAYVGATRARDLLVCPAVGDPTGDGGDAQGEETEEGSASDGGTPEPNAGANADELRGWSEYLNPALYPATEERRAGRPAPGCPEFGEDSVADRPPRARARPDGSVWPGLHRSRAGCSVVWWDPAALDLGKEEAVGLRQQEILRADRAGEVSTAGIRAHQAWRARRRAALAAGAEPQVVLRTVKEVAWEAAEAWEASKAEAAAEIGGRRPAAGPERGGEEGGPDRPPGEPGTQPAVELIEVPRPAGEARPGGARFGDLVHRVLEAVHLEADDEAVRVAARARGRVEGASEEEVEAAAKLVARALEHPLLRRAASRGRAGSLRREAPVFYRRADGTLVEGAVDLAFREEAEDGGGVWTVVDFKTDRDVEIGRAAYVEQVRAYARAISAATGERARGAVLVL